MYDTHSESGQAALFSPSNMPCYVIIIIEGTDMGQSKMFLLFFFNFFWLLFAVSITVSEDEADLPVQSDSVSSDSEVVL
jgi:hypothetical protein